MHGHILYCQFVSFPARSMSAYNYLLHGFYYCYKVTLYIYIVSKKASTITNRSGAQKQSVNDDDTYM